MAKQHGLLALIFMLSWSVPFGQPTSKVSFLPGFEGPLPFELYTGYISVGERNETHLFYYFVKSERNPTEDPLLLWFTGGPGCSAFSGFAFEIGPLKFVAREYDGSIPKLVVNPYSWTKVSNVIFVDAPTGTGFSYSNSKDDYMTSDTKSSNNNYRFLVKWLNYEYPEFRWNPVYIGGDSYSGLPVPFLVQQIANGNQAGNEPWVNLKGYILGNPVTDREFDATFVPFAHGMGLISDELYKATKRSCRGKYAFPQNAECAMNIEMVNQKTSGINTNNILEPNCYLPSTPDPRRSLNFQMAPGGASNLKERIVFPLHCREYSYNLCEYWANDMSVMEALHIRKGTIGEWQRCNWSISLSYANDVFTAIKYHKNLTSSGFRALVYSGDHDAVVPFVGTRRWIASLNYKVIDQWRSWWVDGQIVGFTTSYDHNITLATVMGGGHTAPEYKPKECLAMVGRWFSYTPL